MEFNPQDQIVLDEEIRLASAGCIESMLKVSK